jgi:hypothetical protein
MWNSFDCRLRFDFICVVRLCLGNLRRTEMKEAAFFEAGGFFACATLSSPETLQLYLESAHPRLWLGWGRRTTSGPGTFQVCGIMPGSRWGAIQAFTIFA